MNAPLLGAVIVETLVACGTTDVVLAPGSRNAPVSLALHSADAAGRLRLHVRVDERTAGFTALGLAKAQGRPVAVVITSGTAVANLAPAVMEANAAGVPLLLITADRPAEAVGTGANQVADQVGIFGPSALGVVRLSSTAVPGTAQQAWSGAVQRAHVLAAGLRTRRPGPVQINVEFAFPHIGPVPSVDVRVARVEPSRAAASTTLGSARTVVLVGDAAPEVGRAARKLAEDHHLPLLAEPSSNARSGPNAVARYRLLVETELGSRIERVITVGHPTLSRPVTRLLSREDIELVVVAAGAGWVDIGSRAHVVTDEVTMPVQDKTWLAEWLEADDALGPRPAPGSDAPLDGPGLAAAVVASVGEDANLVFGSSQTIRDADLAPLGHLQFGCWSNRGLSGIDGTVATATGIALATGRPTTLLVGDLTLQHDLGSLVAAPLEPAADLRVVVAHDDGGAIFSTLEQGAPEYAPAFERVFGTPQGVDLAAVGAALGWETTTVTSAADLAAVLARPVRGRQLVVVPMERFRALHHR